MAADLRSRFAGVEIAMVESGNGVFEVTVDGELIFSKRSLKRHAEPGEILELIDEKLKS